MASNTDLIRSGQPGRCKQPIAVCSHFLGMAEKIRPQGEALGADKGVPLAAEFG